MSRISKRIYDEEPVCYCTECYSLKIKFEDSIGADCCMDCGSLDISEALVDEWEKLYEGRYGHKFTERNLDPASKKIASMSVRQFKAWLCDQPEWRNIVKGFFPNFPGGLGKADSIVLFFDKLSQERLLDDFRSYLDKGYKDLFYGEGD